MELKTLPAFAVLKTATSVLLALSTGFLTAGCTSIFFQPSTTRYPYLELDQLSADSVELRSQDQTKLSAWRISSVQARRNHPEIYHPTDLKPNETRGIALQFHGNAENMTSHYRFQMWLLFEGWDVLTFDYRGYGMSEGSTSNLEGVKQDGIAAIDWAAKVAKEKNLPLIIFGQSLGASIAVSALAETKLETKPDPLKLLVIDSAFYSFTSIAREKLNDVWFFWPFQWLGWLLVSNDLSAGPKLEHVSVQHQRGESLGAFSTPALFLHSENDPVVSSSQGEKLYAVYPGEKTRWTTQEPGHVNTLFAEVDKGIPPKTPYREKLKLKLRTIQGSWLETATPSNGEPSRKATSPTSK